MSEPVVQHPILPVQVLGIFHIALNSRLEFRRQIVYFQVSK